MYFRVEMRTVEMSHCTDDIHALHVNQLSLSRRAKQMELTQRVTTMIRPVSYCTGECVRERV